MKRSSEEEISKHNPNALGVGALAGIGGGMLLFELYDSERIPLPPPGCLFDPISFVSSFGPPLIVGAILGAIAGIIFGNKKDPALFNAIFGGIGGIITATIVNSCSLIYFAL